MVILEAAEVLPGHDDVLSSANRLNQLYLPDGVNNAAEFELLCVAVLNILLLANVSINRGVSLYDDLN